MKISVLREEWGKTSFLAPAAAHNGVNLCDSLSRAGNLNSWMREDLQWLGIFALQAVEISLPCK